MTQEQEDAAWRALPEEIKKDMRIIFEGTHQADKDMYDSGWNDATASLLIKLFGKHNLTETEEEKPRFKTGDYVRHAKYHNIFGIFERYHDGAYYPCEVRHEGGDINYFKESDLEVNKPLFDIGDKVREKIAMEREHIITGYHWDNEEWIWYYDMGEDFCAPEDQLIASGKKKQTPSESKHGSNTIQVKAELDDNFWLAYRMELAKVISPKLIVALSDSGLSSDYCQCVIDETAIIVDGIVERLKGGDGK